jgi:hypothetical protein
MGTGD